MRQITIGETAIELHDNGLTVTRFLDGTSVPALAEDNDEYRARAIALEYGADVEAMSRDHEVLHTMISVLLGLPRSPVLWAVAHQDEHRGLAEEEMVLGTQRFCRRYNIDPVAVARSVARRKP